MDDVDREVERALHAQSQRYTAGRRRLVQALRAAGSPLAAPALLDGDDIPASSGYRNLAVLERAGVVRRVHSGDDHARFELADHVSGHHHHHVLCESCGLVRDVELDPALEASLAEQAGNIARATGFSVREHRADFVGLCPSCRE